ncbi:MAG: hypothetical protein Q8M18_10320 [Bradyrhizobium sp.]|nr:hypothetical protein [Bradyrhizobium sp.]
MFDYIERIYNAIGRHSTIGYLSPVEFERKVGLLKSMFHQTGEQLTAHTMQIDAVIASMSYPPEPSSGFVKTACFKHVQNCSARSSAS